jgi:hypothetical protein
MYASSSLDDLSKVFSASDRVVVFHCHTAEELKPNENSIPMTCN